MNKFLERLNSGEILVADGATGSNLQKMGLKPGQPPEDLIVDSPDLISRLAGSFVTALLFLAISAASAFIYEKTTRLSVIYGSITVALVFLYSVYLYASALLFGAGVAAAWSRPPQGPGGPLLVQVRRAIVGLFVHREQPPDQPGSGTSGGRMT